MSKWLVGRHGGVRVGLVCLVCSVGLGGAVGQSGPVSFGQAHGAGDFLLAGGGVAAAIYVAPGNPEAVKVAAGCFSEDVERVTGVRPEVIATLDGVKARTVVIAGVLGSSPEIDALVAGGKIDVSAVAGKWESAVTVVVDRPVPGVDRALVVAGSDRRGVAFALFTLSRAMGVSPWNWWADVPVVHHDAVYVEARAGVQGEPSVQYRGIFLNDEDFGLRPWASVKMDPEVGNVGPHMYERVFELLLRLHANTLWPAMHGGAVAFNQIAENAVLADRWGIVMGSSHSEALLRNNVKEWDEKRDGPWNYQLNKAAIDAYWEKRLVENGKYENFYTVGMRGVHDTGLEATGTVEVKARLVEQVMKTQRELLAKHVNPDLTKVPQIIQLYKESLELYRAGMVVPDDVTLGWTDDNYGYIRQLPTVEEQKRSGGSGVYYHISYWGFPYDDLWLCTTPPALIREEMTKAYDHGARRYWVLNVGDLKPGEVDIDYFLQLAWDEPAMAKVDQGTFLRGWAAEQFPGAESAEIADVLGKYYALNFVRKTEFLGFNGYDEPVHREAFNPLAWGDQNEERLVAWHVLNLRAEGIGGRLSGAYQDAYFELVGYPVEAAAAQNEKFLNADASFYWAGRNLALAAVHAASAREAFDRIHSLTARYNSLDGGKWQGMMSDHPHDRTVFMMPPTATAEDAGKPLPASWGAGTAAHAAVGKGFVEMDHTVSINAAHFAKKSDKGGAKWAVMPELGISGGGSVEYGAPGLLGNRGIGAVKNKTWVEYKFSTVSSGDAVLTIHLLPTFAVDSQHRLRYAVAVDGGARVEMDASGSGEWKENSAPTWEVNVLRNSATAKVPLAGLKAGKHTVRLLYRDPGVVFEHLVLTFDGAPPAYPVPPETVR